MIRKYSITVRYTALSITVASIVPPFLVQQYSIGIRTGFSLEVFVTDVNNLQMTLTERLDTIQICLAEGNGHRTRQHFLYNVT